MPPGGGSLTSIWGWFLVVYSMKYLRRSVFPSLLMWVNFPGVEAAVVSLGAASVDFDVLLPLRTFLAPRPPSPLRPGRHTFQPSRRGLRGVLRAYTGPIATHGGVNLGIDCSCPHRPVIPDRDKTHRVPCHYPTKALPRRCGATRRNYFGWE